MFTPRSVGVSMTELLGPRVARQMRRPVRVAVLVTVEIGDAQALVLAPPIRR